MTVLITLTAAGTDSGPFNLYTNLDGYVSAFETGVLKSALLSGYSSALVPDYTNIIRVKSVGVCNNYIDISLISTTTTTTTAAVINCNETAQSGGVGVTEYSIIMDQPLGGVIAIQFNAQSVPDKLEIIHNNIKVATSGMTVPNSGPFDNIYGDPTVPTVSETNTVDQFIGISKGTIPTRSSEFLSETGMTNTLTKQQWVWFVYSSADYSVSNLVTLRITGPDGTAWDLIRSCESTTTTTTTIAPLYASWDVSTLSSPVTGTACGYTLDQVLYSSPSALDLVAIFYTDTALTTPYVGSSNWYHVREGLSLYVISIDEFGNTSGFIGC